MQTQRIRALKSLGVQKSLDFKVRHSDHNFYAEGIVVSNSHSLATSYLSALTVYLKYKHPAHFYCACLNSARDLAKAKETPQDQVGFIAQELPEFKIQLLPPDITRSEINFAIENGDIRFGLKLIKGIAEKNLEGLQTFRKSTATNKFEVFSAIKNAGLNVGIGCAIIQAGCLAEYEGYIDKEGKPFKSRSRLALEYSMWAKSDLLNDKERRYCMDVGMRPEIGWDVLRAVKYLAEVATDEKGRPLIKDTRFATIKKRYQPYKEIYEQNSRNERLANFFYERTILGYSYSESLLSIFAEHIDGLMTVAQALKAPANTRCKLIGFCTKPVAGKTKAGNKSFSFVLTDESGEIRVKVFNDRIGRIEKQNGRLPVEEDLLIVNCKKMEGDTVFAENGTDGTVIGVQTARIYMKLADLDKPRKVAEDSSIPTVDSSTPQSLSSK